MHSQKFKPSTGKLVVLSESDEPWYQKYEKKKRASTSNKRKLNKKKPSHKRYRLNRYLITLFIALTLLIWNTCRHRTLAFKVYNIRRMFQR